MRRPLLAVLIPLLAMGLWLALSALNASRDQEHQVAASDLSSTDVTAALTSRRAQPQAALTGRRAHPQAVEPLAGVTASAGASSTHTPATTPLGDPAAHARSLAQVKQQLKLLNLCGGTTNPSFAQPLVTSGGPGFVADPGTIQSVGHLPVLTSRLDALAKSLGVTIYGISGYRTPAHSVAVGGFADDPHTKGEAEDIGVSSLLRSSAAQISEAQLARFGLYRPFDPSDDPANSEVNHIQLIPSTGAPSLAEATKTWSPDPRCR